jgi:hypothetical protein
MLVNHLSRSLNLLFIDGLYTFLIYEYLLGSLYDTVFSAPREYTERRNTYVDSLTDGFIKSTGSWQLSADGRKTQQAVTGKR